MSNNNIPHKAEPLHERLNTGKGTIITFGNQISMLHSRTVRSARNCRLASGCHCVWLLLLQTLVSSAEIASSSNAAFATIKSSLSWQDYARTASSAYSKKDYQTAANSYLNVLRLLKSSGDVETVADIRLNLAETYIHSNRFDLAQQQLDAVSKEIYGKQLDPLLRVRFLRRQSQLYSAQGRTAAAVATFAHTTRALSESFSPTHGRVQATSANMSALLDSAVTAWANQSANDQRDALLSLSELQGKKLLSKTNLDRFRTLCLIQVASQIKGKDFSAAAQTLKLTGSADCDAGSIARLWLHWWWQLCATNQEASLSPEIIQQAASTISEQLSTSSNQDVLTAKQILLAGLGHAANKHEVAHRLLISTTHNVYEGALAYECRSKMSLYCFKHACLLLDRNDFGDLAEQFLLEAREIRPRTTSITPTNWKPLTNELINLVQARLYLARNQIDRSATILDAIDLQSIQQSDPDVFISAYAKMMILLAQREIRNGDRLSGKRRFKAITSLLERVKDKQRKGEIERMLTIANSKIEMEDMRTPE